MRVLRALWRYLLCCLMLHHTFSLSPSSIASLPHLRDIGHLPPLPRSLLLYMVSSLSLGISLYSVICLSRHMSASCITNKAHSAGRKTAQEVARIRQQEVLRIRQEEVLRIRQARHTRSTSSTHTSHPHTHAPHLRRSHPRIHLTTNHRAVWYPKKERERVGVCVDLRRRRRAVWCPLWTQLGCIIATPAPFQSHTHPDDTSHTTHSTHFDDASHS